MKLRVLALALAILAFFIFVGSPFQQAAKAVALVDDAVIAIIIAALAAIGITFVTTGGFDTLNEYVGNLFQEYATANNTSVSNLLYGTQSGTDNMGRLLINNRYVVLIDAFAAWLKSKFSLTNHDSITVVEQGASIGDLTCYKLLMIITNNGNNYTYIYSTNPEVNAALTFWNQGNYTPMLISRTPTTFVIQSVTVSSGEINTSTYNTRQFENTSWYVAYGFQIDKNQFSNSINLVGYSRDTIFAQLRANNGIAVNDVGIAINTGGITLPTDNDNYQDGDGAIIDVGADWGSTYQDVIDQTIPDDFSDGKEGEASITYESDQEVEQQVVDTAQNTVSQNVSDYQVPGLQSVFPFCIPFDLYNFVACLEADPVAPSFTWRFYVPGICDESIEIDLSEFNEAAQILRTMELLLFCVGLAFVTRKIIRG